MQNNKTLSDLVRLTEKVGSDHPHHLEQTKFSVLPSLKTKEFLDCLNSNEMTRKAYHEVN